MSSSNSEITDPSGQDPQLEWTAFRLVIVGFLSLASGLAVIFFAAAKLGE
jgi:hypothetical protein